MSESKNRPPEQINWRLEGDKDRADSLRGIGLQLKGQMQRENTFDYSVFSRRYTGKDGTTCTIVRNCGPTTDVYTITIYCPPQKQGNQNAQSNIPSLQPGQFYYVPGCVARYGFINELYNEIPLKRGSAGEGVDTSNTGMGVVFIPLKDSGLPGTGVTPDGSISRDYRVIDFVGSDPDDPYTAPFLELSSWHIPNEGPFSISCVFRLNEDVICDYSQTTKTGELDNGFAVYNEIKARLLFSDDGATWYTHCPGGTAPLIGYKIPEKFYDHWVTITYPWPTYNNNFVQNGDKAIGYREIATICSGEPLLVSPYSQDSPYWDKVYTGGLETLSGKFLSGWAENTDIQNTAPYKSFCTFRVEGAHGKDAGTRAVASLSDGTRRYATVESLYYEYENDEIVATVFTLKDYQYKLYMTEAQAAITFGSQPFPVSRPEGFMIGMNIMGMVFFNAGGTRLVAGKVCNFQDECKNPPIVSDILDLGEWYHAVMSYDEKGKTGLYLTKLGQNEVAPLEAAQSTSKFQNVDGFGGAVGLNVASDNWSLGPRADSPATERTAEWEFSSKMSIGLMRFYHHALKKEEAVLLKREVFDGIFVADDNEAAQLVGSGFQPVTV
jgi:hypothetical protein